MSFSALPKENFCALCFLLLCSPSLGPPLPTYYPGRKMVFCFLCFENPPPPSLVISVLCFLMAGVYNYESNYLLWSTRSQGPFFISQNDKCACPSLLPMLGYLSSLKSSPHCCLKTIHCLKATSSMSSNLDTQDKVATVPPSWLSEFSYALDSIFPLQGPLLLGDCVSRHIAWFLYATLESHTLSGVLCPLAISKEIVPWFY